MNRFIAITVLTGGLLMAAAPAQAEHDERRVERHVEHPAAAHRRWRFDHRNHRGHREHKHRGARHRFNYRRGYHYYEQNRGIRQGHYKYARRGHMPKWLRLQGSFRHWYRHSLRRHDRYLSWHQLYDIYQWQYSRHRYYRH